jgi:LPS O-antigen subunit length determinant protein (WzzB/FepE family)
MKTNRSFIKDDDLDLLELLRKIWKEKVFLIIASLLFMVVGYIYGHLQPKIYKITILLREAPTYLFEDQPSQIKYTNQQTSSLSKDFNNEFKVILSSSENLDRFLKQNNKINEFKLNHKSKNIEIKNNLKEKIEFKIDQEINNSFRYTLTYEEYLAADQFLNDFIYFSKQEAEKFFKKQTAHFIDNKIKTYKENLEIAKKIEGVFRPNGGNNALTPLGNLLETFQDLKNKLENAYEAFIQPNNNDLIKYEKYDLEKDGIRLYRYAD